jgi:peptide/nickel transport system permease protein
VYRLTVTALMLDPASVFAPPTVFVSGHVSGILGTDLSRRDIFTGLVIGIRWALIIGILTSIITVAVGVILGVAAAWFGGALDWLLSRLYELVYLMPVLPFLIVISAIFKPSIWTLIVIICLFFWTGPFKPVYGMALQIRTETYIEASRGLGARSGRIIFRHIVPLLLPYSFAVMALGVPAVIVYEASVSLLGLGDSSIVTWGQMLHDALAQGAVIDRLWWWVVPPGLMIALMGMSFAFLGTALDRILHPRLKRR